MVKAMHRSIVWPFLQFCYVFLGMQRVQQKPQWLRILKSFLQGQGPYLCIQAHGQRACGLPKVTHSVNNRAQRRIPTAYPAPISHCP